MWGQRPSREDESVAVEHVFLNHRHNWGLASVIGLTGDKTAARLAPRMEHKYFVTRRQTGAAAPHRERVLHNANGALIKIVKV